MATNGNGVSAIAGFALFMTFVLFCYLEGTTSNPVWSLIYFGGAAVSMISAAAKWATALNAETKLIEYADKLTSIVPIVALYFTFMQALRYNHDGVDGMMATWAAGTFILLIGFGVADAFASMFGKKFQQMTEAAAEVQRRASAVVDVASGNQPRR